MFVCIYVIHFDCALMAEDFVKSVELNSGNMKIKKGRFKKNHLLGFDLQSLNHYRNKPRVVWAKDF